MSGNNYQNTKAYNTNFVPNPSLRRRYRRRRNIHTAEEDYTLNDDYNLLLQSTSIQCPPLTGPHIEAANKHVQNGSYSNPLEHEDISVAVENAVLSIVKNEPISPDPLNNDTDADLDEEEGRRRKYGGSLYNGELHEQTLQAANNQEEVTRAARSLFSKRTRTLYNWLSPGISKSRLKTAVSAAWDRLPSVEKDFYISQVLGRFGVPSVRVMVNPQILGFSCTTASCVPEVTATDNNNSNNNIMDTVNGMSKRKRQRVYRSRSSNSSFSMTDDTVHQGEDDDKIIVKQIQDEPLHEFVDDPELHKEFEQFKWALHVSNVHN